MAWLTHIYINALLAMGLNSAAINVDAPYAKAQIEQNKKDNSLRSKQPCKDGIFRTIDNKDCKV